MKVQVVTIKTMNLADILLLITKDALRLRFIFSIRQYSEYSVCVRKECRMNPMSPEYF